MTTPDLEPASASDAEAALVQRARNGDLDAFNLLVDAHQRLTYNLCFRMLGNREAAEDATQDAFLSAFRALSTFKGASFRSWLMRIAANACTDELRRRGRRPAVSLATPAPGADAPIDVADPASGPEDLTLQSEQRAAVQAALLKLPPDQRLAVIMCDLEGFAYEEIAEAMRTSIGTVKSRIARGRDKLRRVLAQLEEQSAAPERP